MTLLCPPILIAQSGLGLIDYAVLVAYLAATMLIGSWLCRGQNTLSDYFLAGRSTHWLVACVSIIATDISALSYMGVPGWIYEKDLKYSVGALLYPFVMVVVVVIFVPVFFRLKVFTVYEYLETRFHPAARTLTAILFMFQRGVLLAGAIYIPAVALSTFTGRPYRLVRDAEYEKAARGGLVGRRFPWGDESPEGRADCNNMNGSPRPVGSFPPNGYGLHDMAGSMWSWCEECYEQIVREDRARMCYDDTLIKDVRLNPICRGGSFKTADMTVLHCAYRHEDPTDGRFDCIGLRVAMTG